MRVRVCVFTIFLGGLEHEGDLEVSTRVEFAQRRVRLLSRAERHLKDATARAEGRTVGLTLVPPNFETNHAIKINS